MTGGPDRGQVFRKHYALPSEHGSWIWWIGPFLIGTAAAGALQQGLLLLFVTAFAAFLSRQPITLLVKVASRRRPESDRAPAWFWTAVYGSVVALGLAGLVRLGFGGLLLLLAIPATIVFVWHLWLVSRREERGQMGIELVGAGVLALTAPAAYWVSGGVDGRTPWLLWLLCWLQSAASIVLVYLRLDQRRWPAVPPPAECWRAGRRALAYHLFNVLAAVLLVAWRVVPGLVPVAFAIMLADAVDGILRPGVGARPTTIGLRQLGASLLFVILVAAAYLLA
ncbi:MAG: YwiC-like family protein [Anaerolineales bacterium]|nr:YwiC-like family protein [Anaerolineales bacterium]